jgi:serine/threonine protein kinase
VDSTDILQTIGRYQVARELGLGGMGVVYLAKDPFIDRSVAIKTTLNSPPNGLLSRDQFQLLFFYEVKASGKLTHPHIVSVHDVTAENGNTHWERIRTIFHHSQCIRTGG